jgi:hypothetical protein
MSLLSFFGYKDEPEIEEAKKQCDNLMKTANDQVKERKAKAAAAPAPTPAAVQSASAGGGRRRKTSRKSPSKKRATKSMYSKIKKWNLFK